MVAYSTINKIELKKEETKFEKFENFKIFGNPYKIRDTASKTVRNLAHFVGSQGEMSKMQAKYKQNTREVQTKSFQNEFKPKAGSRTVLDAASRFFYGFSKKWKFWEI